MADILDLRFELAYCDPTRPVEDLDLPQKKPKGFVKKHGGYPVIAAEAVRRNNLLQQQKVSNILFFPSPLQAEKVGG